MALTLGLNLDKFAPLLLVNSDVRAVPLNQALAEFTRRLGDEEFFALHELVFLRRHLFIHHLNPV